MSPSPASIGSRDCSITGQVLLQGVLQGQLYELQWVICELYFYFAIIWVNKGGEKGGHLVCFVMDIASCPALVAI